MHLDIKTARLLAALLLCAAAARAEALAYPTRTLVQRVSTPSGWFSVWTGADEKTGQPLYWATLDADVLFPLGPDRLSIDGQEPASPGAMARLVVVRTTPAGAKCPAGWRVLDARLGAHARISEPVGACRREVTISGEGNGWELRLPAGEGAPEEVYAYDRGRLVPIGKLTLRQAVALGQARGVELALARGEPPDSPGREGCPVLTQAATAGHAEVVRLLLARGARPDSPKPGRCSPLLTPGSTEVARLLLAAGASVSVRGVEARTPLLEAAARGQAELAGLLLDQRARLEDHDDGGRTALALAVHGGDAATIQLLLDRGALVDGRDGAGETALWYAVAAADRALAGRLLDAGANPNLPVGEDRETVLMKAAGLGDLELVKLLLAHGADRAAQSRDGWVAADYPRGAARKALVPLLRAPEPGAGAGAPGSLRL
ncbi:MAG: ankyrin repeat domain-containing protein [Anaeromyxobacter sp.]